jgi:hypothetical protein
MKFELKPLRILALLLGCAARVSSCDYADAKPKRPYENASATVYEYGIHGANRSYQTSPNTRVYVTKRSWLDGGTEVASGERKFSDYAFPPGYSFARENNNRPLDRQPLNSPWDMGGYLMTIPLY